MLIISGVNVYPSAVRDVISTLATRVTGEMVIILQQPPPAVNPPMEIRVEHGEVPADLNKLKKDIEALLREKLVFSSKVELVSWYPQGPCPSLSTRPNWLKRPMKNSPLPLKTLSSGE